MGDDNWQFDIIASQISDLGDAKFIHDDGSKTNFKDQLVDVFTPYQVDDNSWINNHSADIDSYDTTNNALSVYDVDGNGLGDIVITDFNRVHIYDTPTVAFTASIDKWQPGDQTSSTWIDGPSMKLHRKDIAENEVIELIAKDGTPGHKHKPDMDKGSYELRVEHDQNTDGAINMNDVMGVLSVVRGKTSLADKDNEYELAADWDGNGIINMNDVMGVLSKVRGKTRDDEWRFYDKASETSIWDNATKTNKMDIELDADNEIDLTAILRGDIDSTYNPSEHNRVEASPAPTPNYAPLPVNDDELQNLHLDIV